MMKYLYIISIIIFVSCNKNDEPQYEPFPYWGTVTADLNGVEWSANSSYAKINLVKGEGLNIRFSCIDEFEILRNYFSFSKVPFELGTSKLENANLQENDGKVGAFFGFAESDLLLASYDVLEEDSTSFITLESYDVASGEVKGTFETTFILENHYDTTKDFPDTLRFRNGAFHTRIVE